MSDGVSINTNPAINNNVLMEILGASSSVQSRIAAYQDAKSGAEKALADLKLGQDVQTKYSEASALQAQAQAAADAAKKQLADAQAKAAQIVADAKAHQDQMTADLAKAQADHNNSIAAANAAVAAEQQKLASSQAATARAKAAAQAAADAATAAQVDAIKAKEAHDAACAELKAKTAELQSAISRFTG